MTITNDQIAQLAQEAAAAGDAAQLRLCAAAIDGDQEARAACESEIASARAKMDHIDIAEDLEDIANKAIPGIVRGGTYRCPTGATIDIEDMAKDIEESGSADVRVHRSSRPRARELDQVINAWRIAGYKISA